MDNAYQDPPPPPSLRMLRLQYRVVVLDCINNPHMTVEQVCIAHSIDDLPGIMAALEISPEQFVIDLAATKRFNRLTKLINLRIPGQAERQQAVQRIHKFLKSKAIPESEIDSGYQQLEIELNAYDELARLERVRRAICNRHPVVFLQLDADGNYIDDAITGEDHA